MIITVQALNEHPEEVANSCKEFGMRHYYAPLEGANQALIESVKGNLKYKSELKKAFKHMC